MRDLLRYICTLLLTLLCACHQGGGVDDDQISVTLKLGTTMLTRGAVTDSPSNPSAWSQAERAVDGRYIYMLSVYIVDAEKNIVARRENIAVNDQASEVVVEFDKSYNFKRGVHTLMVVANHSDHRIGNTTYSSGLTGAWSATDYDALMSNQISASGNNISPKDVIQPLSLMQEFEIHTGSNFVEGELVRSIARLRIEVKNDSGVLPLKINNLTFSNDFAQRGAYVFDDGSDDKYSFPKGAIVATSTDALQPFVRDASKSYKTINSQSSAVVYDGYLLESKDADGFTYTLNMSYEDASWTLDVYSRDSDVAIKKAKDMKNVSEEYFLIYNPTTQKYLSVDGSSVVLASIGDFDAIAARNIWQITYSDSRFYIKNVESNTYLKATNNTVTLSDSRDRFNLSDKSNAILIKDYETDGRYLYIDGETVKGGYSDGYANMGFYFYKITKTTTTKTEDINREAVIPLTAIDPVSQQSSKVTAIKRNDFINALVTVSYNPYSGEFDFRVEDWETGGGQVDFN